ncbi:hypothetical protein DFP73DRAFT_577751 [Morchella snyderi]|nr:hypothetical protein DFP73DRAFT_577751 [Morchella snyderi]
MSSLSSEHRPAAVHPPAKPKQPKWTLDVSVKIVCPYCREDPPNLIEEYSSGDTICGSCGLVMADHMIDERAEWRTFSSDDPNKADPNRAGAAQGVFESGTGFDTSIADIKGDRNAQQMKRVHRKINSSTESRFLTRAYAEIEIYCEKNGIQNDVRDVAKHIYKTVDEGMKLNNRSAIHEAVVASCILIACRQCKVDRTFREIFLLTNVPKKEIGRTFKRIEHYLLKSSVAAPSDDDSTAVPRALMNQYISTSHTEAGKIMIRFCNILGYDMKFTLAAQELVRKMTQDSIFCSRSPLSIAGGAIYTIAKVLNVKAEQATIARCLGVSMPNISSMFRRINSHKNEYFGPDSTITTVFKAINVRKHEYFDPAYLKRIGGSLDGFPYLEKEEYRFPVI